MTALFITVPYANAATWLSSHNKLGNIIYFDADTIQKKDNVDYDSDLSSAIESLQPRVQEYEAYI